MRCRICGGTAKPAMTGLFDDRHGYPGEFTVYKCQRCGFGQTKPELKAEEIAEVYNRYYPRQNFEVEKVKEEDYKVGDRQLLQRKGLLINCQYHVTPGSLVLDVGCGLGYSLLELKSMGCKAYGIDPDVRGQLMAKKFKLKFHRGFIEDQPFKGIKFDFVIGSQVLEHTNNPAEFIRVCKSRLKPGGKIILSFPNYEGWSMKLCGRKWLHWHIPYHINFFTRQSLIILADKAGVRIEKIETYTANAWLNYQLRRLMIKAERGVRDGYWEGGALNIANTRTLRGRLATQAVQAVFNFQEKGNPLLRLADKTGFGDSLVVTFA